jgi:hypothetical protein
MVPQQASVRLAFCCTILIIGFGVGLWAQTNPLTQPSVDLRKLTVQAIDDCYLFAASNPAWEKARTAILAADFHDRVSIIPRQLADLRDSELNFVSATELARISEESNGRSVAKEQRALFVHWDIGMTGVFA